MQNAVLTHAKCSAISCKTQGYLIQNARLNAAKSRMKGKQCPLLRASRLSK